MKKYKYYDNGVSVNTKPTMAEIKAIQGRITAFDAVIYATMDLCPMKKSTESVHLSWDWAIVTVAGFDIPALTHPNWARGESILYTVYNTPVELSHIECALTTAYFYFYMGWQMQPQFKDLADKHPVYGTKFSGLDDINELGKDQCYQMLRDIRQNLTSKGLWVLD